MTWQLGLAPMEGVSDFPFRLWQSLVAPPARMSTPFLRATASFPAQALPVRFAPELDVLAGKLSYRLIPQVMAAEPEHFVRAAELFLARSPVVELNCGCPSPTCTGKGAGSSLLSDARGFAQFLATIARALGANRLAIKMRTGYHDASELPQLLAGIAPHGFAQLTVHGRTRPERYRNQARWDLIEFAARELSIPVIASGDIVDRTSYEALRTAAPHAAGAIVGRGALRHPFIFRELDGLPVSFPAGLLPRMVGAFAKITQLYATDFDRLVRLVDDGLVASVPGSDPNGWDHVLDRLGGSADCDRQSLGRAKMLWGYLRSSLPDTYFAPQTLRAQTLGELLAAITALAPNGDLSSPLVPRHRRELDWIYSGERRPESCSPTVRPLHK